MTEGNPGFSGIEQPAADISRTTLIAAFNRFQDLQSQFYNLPPGTSSGDRGILDGRVIGAKSILRAMHQNPLEKPAEDRIIPSSDEVVRTVLVDYADAYITYLLSKDSKVRIPILDRLLGRRFSTKDGWQRALGVNEGIRVELRTFLEGMGGDSKIEETEKRLDRLYKLNPTELRRQKRYEAEVKSSQAMVRLKRESENLAEGFEEETE